VLAELKSNPATAAIPVVMLTMVDQRNAGFALGAADFLVKPVDRTRLLDVLARFRRGEGEQMDVLIVDDEPEVRSLLGRTLEKEGCRIREATSGQQALDRIAEAIPGLVLLDLMMPVMSGFELLDRLRARAEWAEIPVVVVTAADLGGADRAVLTEQVQHVIQKGGSQNELLLAELRRWVQSAVQKHGARR